ncbi:hypothetical protein FRC12_010689 [Ceratobasidium sp. 428]|nr:hypothetical protein FRC12_010689 [Ceratobasidium sp. 428]
MNEVQLATHQHNFISGSMPISVIIQRLVNHGCPNISNRLDAIHCNDIPFSRGGFGDVHQGTLLDGTKVALKCLRLYVSETESNRRALKYAARELHTWSKCQHPNIMDLLGLVEFRGQIAMVSLWMENGSVDHLDVNNHAIDRCRICFGAAQGLAYLHKIGIVHGDIKGGNIMLSNNNDAQLADFGNAVLASSVLTFTESSAHSRLSTRWAAPEQLLGEATYSRQADIYSLGMTILVRPDTNG